MLTTGYMEKVIKNGEPYLRLTGIGKKALVRDFPIFSLKDKKWDGKWRIVFYDIPEKEKNIRKMLQVKLLELGFGMIQESVYISPFDIAEDLREFLIAQKLEEIVFISVADKLFAGNEKLLTERVWRLGDLNEEYLDLYQRIKKGENLEEIFSTYEEILRRDPCLPRQLLPDNWLGEKVYQEISKRLKTLKS